MVKKYNLIFLSSLLVLFFLVGILHATQITEVTWAPDTHIIHISLDAFPTVWPGWRMFIDGTETSLEGSLGNVVVRPDAPLSQPPTGLIVGTLPWVTGLDNVDFPCCGTMQFDIPSEGLTNIYQFNVKDLGCLTASQKECKSEWTVHEGDLVISGEETYAIENARFFQKGNIYVNDHTTLIIRNSELMMARGNVPTIHVYIFVDPMATLIIDNSRVYPSPDGGLACVINRGAVTMTGSPTSIHYFDMSEGAHLEMSDSEMIYTIGGLLQVSGGDIKVTNSTLGALGLNVPAGAHLTVTDLHSGVYFESWDVHQMIPDANYNLTLQKTTILEDDFTGELEHGPYERGWVFFLDRDAHVRISNSELRKVFLDLKNDTAEFQKLKVGIPSSLNYRDIALSDIIVKGQWPFTIVDSNVTITDSDYLFLQPSGTSTVKLVNAHIVEFIPRDFSGTMIFEDGLWTNAGEIIGGVPYHSIFNDFSIKGSLRMEGLRENLQFKGARVTREFDVVVTDGYSQPQSGVVIKIGGQTYVTGAAGIAKFNIVFDESNYKQSTALEVWDAEGLITRKDIDFFTKTPIEVKTTSTMIYLQSPANDVVFDSCSLINTHQPLFSWNPTGTFTKYTILFSTSSSDFSTKGTLIAKKNIKGTGNSWTPAIGLWKKIMALSNNTGNFRDIYWKVVGTLPDRTTVESEVLNFRIAIPRAVTINLPNDGSNFPQNVLPTFDFNTNCNVKFGLELSSLSGFDNPKKIKGFVFTTRDPNVETIIQRTLTAGRWNAVKKLVGTEAGYFRIKAWDMIKRQTISEVMSFTIQ